MLYTEAAEKFHKHMQTCERSEKTIYGYLKDLEAFHRFYEARNNCQCYIEDIRIDDVEAFMRLLQAKGLKPASRNRIVHALRSFYKFLRTKGLCEVNIMEQVASIKVPKQERTYLTDDEVHMITKAMRNPIMRTVTYTLYYSGLRISECLNLRLQDVDFETATIRVIGGKGGKDRLIPINHKLFDILSAYKNRYRLHATPEEAFFATLSTGSLSASYYNTYLKKVVERQLGWKKRITAHTFRHSFASSLVRNGVNLVHIQKLLGHSSLAVTSVYTHAKLADLSEAVNVL
ncbi:tyrosine recombinase XerD [Alicyclobacillus acidoterrestris]|nr:tyrosine recombinase XerD [Alicyclobacillus acidoterrestris]